MSGSTSASTPWDPMAALMGLFGNSNSTNVPNYGGFNTSTLQGPTANGQALSANPMNLGSPVIGGTGTGATTGAGTQLGINTGTGQLALGGLQTIGNLWNAYNANTMANKTFNLNKDLANVNLTNQTQAYNTNLAGQATARYAQENNPGGAAAYISANQLAQKTV